MHNEGTPRHHTGAPGPFLYLKPRRERVGSRAPRIRSPGSRFPSAAARSEFRGLLAPGAQSFPERGQGQGGGGGDPAAWPRERGCENCEVIRAAEPGTEESPAARSSAGAEHHAPPAPRAPAASPRPSGAALRASSRRPTRAGPAWLLLSGSPGRGAGTNTRLYQPPGREHGWMRTPMPEVRGTRTNFFSGPAAAARASSPLCTASGGRCCPRC